jgi:hypothetical protein
MDENVIHCGNDIDDKNRRGMLLAALATLAAGNTAQAQDAPTVQPRAYRVALDNAHLRVLEYNSRPGLGVCGTGVHSHPAHLTVVLASGKVRWRLPDGKTGTAEGKLGDVFWSEAETHEVENISGKDMRTLLVELKTPTAAKS